MLREGGGWVSRLQGVMVGETSLIITLITVCIQVYKCTDQYVGKFAFGHLRHGLGNNPNNPLNNPLNHPNNNPLNNPLNNL